MKKLVLSLALLLFSAVGASAEVKDFAEMKVDVPAGWMAQEQGPVAVFASPDQQTVAMVVLLPNDGSDLKNMAEAMSREANGSTPVQEGDAYLFDAEHQGQKIRMFLRSAGNKVVAVTMGGDYKVLMALARSVQPK